MAFIFYFYFAYILSPEFFFFHSHFIFSKFFLKLSLALSLLSVLFFTQRIDFYTYLTHFNDSLIAYLFLFSLSISLFLFSTVNYYTVIFILEFLNLLLLNLLLLS
jgi:hypothetical protein